MPAQAASEAQRPSSLACVPCRGKHLKCDAKIPSCTRCQKQGISCNYVRSKRGLRKFKALETGQVNGAKSSLGDLFDASYGNNNPRPSNDYHTEPTGGCSLFPTTGALTQCENEQWSSNIRNTINPEVLCDIDVPELSITQELEVAPCISDNPSAQGLALDHTQQIEGSNGDDMFIDLFYTHFYPAHPFIIPQRLFRLRKVVLPKYLRDAIVFTGSHFSTTASCYVTKTSAFEVLYNDNPKADGFYVQALLLLSLVFHARCEETDCIASLRKASELATQLRMFDESYASQNDFGMANVAESWRRTWWELLALDVLLPTFHPGKYESCLQHIQTNLYLPSEEVDYASCRTLQEVKTQKDFGERLFREDSYYYSSFAFKIEAVRLLDLARRSSRDEDNISLQSMDSGLSNFFLSLPESKREVVGLDGVVDEVLFSAHVIANVAALLFHRCYSTFAYAIHQPTQCTTQEFPKSTMPASPRHTSKALSAADRLSNAVGAHLAIKRRSPFLTCAIALAASIHLPAYMNPCYTKDRPALKERLQLSISALQMIGEIWPIAKVVKSQISRFAREVLFENQGNQSHPLELELHVVPTQSTTSDDSWLDYLSPSGEQG